MSKCVNCIHYDCCLFLKNKPCMHYKDKSLFVELPCRCKDCEYAKEIKLECETVYKCIAEVPARLVTADDFCQYAERKLSEVEE